MRAVLVLTPFQAIRDSSERHQMRIIKSQTLDETKGDSSVSSMCGRPAHLSRTALTAKYLTTTGKILGAVVEAGSSARASQPDALLDLDRKPHLRKA